MEHKEPLRKFGLFKMQIQDVQRVKFKSQDAEREKIVVSFKDDLDRWIDANFILPMNNFSKKAYETLLKEAGVTTPKELKGRTLVVLIAPQQDAGGKIWWNPKKYFSESFVKYLKDGDDPFGMDQKQKPKDEFSDL